MGCYDLMCLGCGLEHINGQDLCIVEICQIVWQREGAPPLEIPHHLQAIYGGYGVFDPTDAAFYGKVALFDTDAVDARDMEDILASVSEKTDYIVSVMAYGQKCMQEHDRCECGMPKKKVQAACVCCALTPFTDAEEEEEPVAAGGA